MGTFNCQTNWTGGMSFEAEMRSHKVIMDTREESGGTNKGATPKELLLAGICGCSGVDVVSIIKKMRLNLEHFDVQATTETTDGYPSIFREVQLSFRIKSSDAKPEQVVKAVNLSMTKYCGVSAMVAPTSPITYQVFLNDEKIGEGKADFSAEQEKAF